MKHDDGFDDERPDEHEVGDPRFVDRLRTVAAEYNRPPETPREDMWAAIVASRQGTAGNRPAHGSGSGLPRWIAMAAAAGFLLATGVGVGLWLAPNGTPVTQVAQIDTTVGRSVNPRNPQPVADATDPGRSVTVRGSAGDPAGRDPLVPAPETRFPSANLSYRLATVRHLSEVETFLTSFQPESSTATLDAEVGTWARDLLTNTRLLLDSPAAEDALRRRLLEDLELVLVQIVQLSPKAGPKDWDIIERGMRREQVMTRLRTAIPAGQSSGN